MASCVTKPVPLLSIPIMSGRMLLTRLAVVAMTLTRPEPAAAPPRRPLPASKVSVPRLVVLEAATLTAVIDVPAEPAVRANLLAPSRFVIVFTASTTVEPPPRKSRIPPRMLIARSAVVACTLVVPPRRLARTLVLLSSLSVPPSARMVVTKPTRAVVLSSVTIPPLICRVPRMLAELSPARFQLPAPILVTFKVPTV